MKAENCLSHWFPRLRDTGVAVPRTIIRHADCDLSPLLDGRMPDGIDDFLCRLHDDMDAFNGPPWFLRTGHTSAKHDWKRTCFINDGSIFAIGSAVASIVDFSCRCDLPVDVWASREFIPTRPKFTAFGGTPISREHRFFFADGNVICNHPLWPYDSIVDPSIRQWRYHLQSLHETPRKQIGHLAALTARVARDFPGAWSLDWLKSTEGAWYAIDCALAADSFHWEGCPHKDGFIT